jgi:hypothetical protein
MGLRQQAAADLKTIVEDAAGGFGWPITITSPADVTAALTGLATDIGYTIDPQTGQAVVGRKASVALAIASLTAAGLDMPHGIGDSARKPWRVVVADVAGTVFTFKVTDALPDRAAGVVVCILETYLT